MSSAARFLRSANGALLGSALAALAVGLWVWTPLPPGLWHDDGVYLLLGKSLASGEGLHYFGVPGTPPAPKFPPGYPLVVALAWIVGGDALGAARAAALFNVVFLAGAVGVMVAYGMRALDLPVRLAVAAGALATVSVDFWRPAMIALSEPLYVLVLVAALWAAARAERADSGGREWAALALTLAVLMYVRTAGIAVVAAVLVALALRRRWKTVALVGGAVGAALVPWAIWSGAAGRAIPGPLLDILGPYGAWLSAQIGASPGAYVAALPANALAIALAAIHFVLPDAHPLVFLLAVLPVVVALVAGTIALWKRSPAAALSLLFALALATVWPFQGDRRLVMPMMPLLLLALACLADDARRQLAGAAAHRWSYLATLGALGVWAMAFASVSVIRLGLDWVPAGYEERAKLLSSSLETMRGNVPPDAVVGSPELWPALPLLLPVRAVPSARFQPMQIGGQPMWGTPEQQFRLWIAAGMDYLLLEDLAVHETALNILDAACPGAVHLVDSRPGVMLVQLRWDAACKAKIGVS